MIYHTHITRTAGRSLKTWQKRILICFLSLLLAAFFRVKQKVTNLIRKLREAADMITRLTEKCSPGNEYSFPGESVYHHRKKPLAKDRSCGASLSMSVKPLCSFSARRAG